MNFEQYMPTVMKRCKVLPFHEHLVHMAMGIIGESGEICDAIKKAEIYGKPLDMVNLLEEVGDALWYVTGAAHALGVSPVMLEQAYSLAYTIPVNQDEALTEFAVYETASLAAAAEILLTIRRPSSSPSVIHTFIDTTMNAIGSICARFNLDINEVLERNDAKLEARHGAKYNAEKVMDRNLDNERAVLEGKPAVVETPFHPPWKVEMPASTEPVLPGFPGYNGFVERRPDGASVSNTKFDQKLPPEVEEFWDGAHAKVRAKNEADDLLKKDKED